MSLTILPGPDYYPQKAREEQEEQEETPILVLSPRSVKSEMRAVLAKIILEGSSVDSENLNHLYRHISNENISIKHTHSCREEAFFDRTFTQLRSRRPSLSPTGSGVNGAMLLKEANKVSFVRKDALYSQKEGNGSFGINPVEGAIREGISLRLGNMLGLHAIPPTLNIKSPKGHTTIQLFQEDTFSLGDCRRIEGAHQSRLERINPDEIARLMIFDTLFTNGDRHDGNILIKDDGSLVAIDNEELLSGQPEKDMPKTHYLSLPQMQQALSEEVKNSLKRFNISSCSQILDNHKISTVALKVFNAKALLFKQIVVRSDKDGPQALTAKEIGLLFTAIHPLIAKAANDSAPEDYRDIMDDFLSLIDKVHEIKSGPTPIGNKLRIAIMKFKPISDLFKKNKAVLSNLYDMFEERTEG
ncbi:MAG: hypothetical protein ACI9S8_000526 [Chlamydiales bacterium]|jgi:hypothetical protein